MFLFIALLIGLITFISNIIYIKDIQFAFIIGIFSAFISVYKDVRNETKIKHEADFIKIENNVKKNINEQYISKISHLGMVELKDEDINDYKNIEVSERAKRTINKSKRKSS